MPVHADISLGYSVVQAREGLFRQSERMSDTFVGLTVLFSAVGALVLCAGFYLHAPFFALSASFAFAAGLAFALCAWRLAHLGDVLQSAAAPSPATFHRPHIRWRKAA